MNKENMIKLLKLMGLVFDTFFKISYNFTKRLSYPLIFGIYIMVSKAHNTMIGLLFILSTFWGMLMWVNSLDYYFKRLEKQVRKLNL